MAYGSESHTPGIVYYRTIVNHTATNVDLEISVRMYNHSDGSAPSEATKDQMFQALLTKIATLSGVTVTSADKRGEFIQTVTP